MKTISIAEKFIKTLAQQGIKYIFGIPGGAWLPYLEYCKKYGIKYILVSHESNAAIMADVYHRVTGKIAACNATLGPGATNLSTGVCCAYLDRSPLLAITSEYDSEMLNKKAQMNINHQKLFEPITKFTGRLDELNFNQTISRAFHNMLEYPFGAVHLGIPLSLHLKKVNDSSVKIDCLKPNNCIDEAMIINLKEILTSCKKPIAVFGIEAVKMANHSLLHKFIDKFQIPFLLTPMAKGILSENDPLCAGVLFHAKCDLAASIYRNADLVVGVGYDPVEFNYESWMPDVPLLHLGKTICDSALCKLTQINLPIDLIISKILQLDILVYKWNKSAILKTKAKIQSAFLPLENRFSTIEVIAILQNFLPDDGFISCDVGAHTHLIGQMWEAKSHRQLLMTNGCSTMGFGIPAAIAAKIAEPEKQVVCVVGDGGFLMSAGELITARREHLKITFIVLSDNEFSLIKVKQHNKNYQNYATNLYDGDLFNAKSFLGLPIINVCNSGELYKTLLADKKRKGSVIINAKVDSSVYKDLITVNYK